MLEYLRIQDLALIEDMELEFSSGVNVLSGETGAGKSFILKALNFLTGEKLDVDLVRPGKEKAVAEAVFILPGPEVEGPGQAEGVESAPAPLSGELVIRRELTAESGRSRLFINDRLSSLESARELRPALLLHTSQHGQQKLLQPSFQSRLLDDFLNRPDLLAGRDALLRSLAELAEKRNALQGRFRELEDKRELLEYQRQEIEKVNPRAGEEEELEERRRELRQAESGNAAAEQALEALHGPDGNGGILDALASLERALRQLAKANPDFQADLDGLGEIYPALADLSSRLRRGAVTLSEQDIEALDARLFALSQLRRKLKRSLPEILSLHGEITENLAFLDSCALDLKQLAREEKAQADKLAELLAVLNPARRSVARELKRLLEAELRDLGFSEQVEVEFAFTRKNLYPGRDDCAEERAQIFWKPNPGQAAQALDKIASGGELSRFLLALVSILARRMAERPTLIFDEVDSGVGGITLNKVAEKLRRLGGERQLILITHWPVLAASSDRHFLVRKEVREGETYTVCERLAGQAVGEEIARMAGGGEQGRALARELLAAGKS
ncbi:AAA family ATPase [Desulfovibrio sp. OttesenSCG-928-C14]|nr:AAA family ATPase [Desulfovibrio sp. OttesenSCG-928-C14]